MFKELVVFAVVVGSIGMNGCTQAPGAAGGVQQVAQGMAGGARLAAPGGAQFADARLMGGIDSRFDPARAFDAKPPGDPATLATPRQPAATQPTGSQLRPGIDIPNSAGFQNVGYGLIWDQNIGGYRDPGTGERMTPAQARERSIQNGGDPGE